MLPHNFEMKGTNMKEYIKESIESYHNNKDIPSRSTLLCALKSPAHLRKCLEGKTKITDNMKLGTFIHDFIESGINLPQHWTTQQEIYQRTTNGRPAGSPKLDEDGNPLFSYINQYNSEENLTPAKSVLAVAMMSAIENDPFIVSAMGLGDLVVEPSFYGEIEGMKVKARPDLAFEDCNNLIEIKTTSSLDPDDIAREFFEYGYDIQAFLELELSGADSVYFYFISSESPAGTARFVVSRDSVWYTLGKQRAIEGLKAYYAHKDSTQDSYTRGEIIIPISYKAAKYMAECGIEE